MENNGNDYGRRQSIFGLFKNKTLRVDLVSNLNYSISKSVFNSKFSSIYKTNHAGMLWLQQSIHTEGFSTQHLTNKTELS